MISRISGARRCRVSLLILSVLLLPFVPRSGIGEDCNLNGIEDAVDVESGGSEDCNGNELPDECEDAPLELVLGSLPLDLPGTPRDTATIDLEGDGLADLITVVREGAVVLRSQGDSGFDDAVLIPFEDSPRALAVADLDGDGDEDLITANSASLYVLENGGEGIFSTPQSIPVPSSTRFVAAGDVTGDGRLDLVATNSSGDQVLVLERATGGSYGEPRSFSVGDSPVALALADLDGDGDLDTAVINGASEDITILWNGGSGEFDVATRLELRGARPNSVLALDLDGDAAPDLAVATEAEVMVWLNRGDGNLGEPIVHAGLPSSLAATDLDGDGDPDLVFGDFLTNTLSVLMNLGEGRFLAGAPLIARFKRRIVSPGDFDGDGDIDLATTGTGFNRVSVLWNREHGRNRLALRSTTAVIGVRPHGIGMGDLNGDGFPDVITSNGHFDTLSVLMSNGDGSFAVRVEYSARSVGHFNDVDAVDVDGDGDLDLVGVDQDGSALRVFSNRGNGTFTAAGGTSTSSRPWTMSEADLDDDGDMDLMVACRGGGTVNVFLNDGQGQFPDRQSLRVGTAPLNVAAGDLDGDLDIDLVVSNSGSGTVSILLGVGDGSFLEASHHFVPGSPGGVALGDFDHDGDLDAATSIDSRLAVFANRGDGTFLPPMVQEVFHPTYTLIAAEVGGDGLLDLVTANLALNSATIFLGRGDGTFEAQEQLRVGQQPLAVVAGDLDQDGDQDIVTANRGSHDVTALLNQSAPPFFEEDYLEVICTGLDYFKMSVPARDEVVERVLKFIAPARDDPVLLPTLFQNSSRYPLHQHFLRSVFPERFPGLTTAEYDRLVSRRETRSYFAGSISRFRPGSPVDDATSDGVLHGFSVAADEVLNLEEVTRVYEELRASFRLEPLGYRPETTLHREAAREWQDPGFPIYLDDRAPPGGYEPYTRAVGYGRVRLLDEDGLDSANTMGLISFQNILVLERAPRDIEGVVGGVITAEPQGELSHLALRTARRNTPNAFVADAMKVFTRFEGKARPPGGRRGGLRG